MASVGTRELHWEKLGKWIKDYREQQNITQVELAERANMKQPNISRLEKGDHTATLETLVAVADALDVHIIQMIRILLGKKF